MIRLSLCFSVNRSAVFGAAVCSKAIYPLGMSVALSKEVLSSLSSGGGGSANRNGGSGNNEPNPNSSVISTATSVKEAALLLGSLKRTFSINSEGDEVGSEASSFNISSRAERGVGGGVASATARGRGVTTHSPLRRPSSSSASPSAGGGGVTSSSSSPVGGGVGGGSSGAVVSTFNNRVMPLPPCRGDGDAADCDAADCV